jgi:hypothetical protein
MKVFSFFTIALTCQLVCAQKVAEVNLDLLDGNQIKGTTTLNDVEFLTSYGKLNIPISKISNVKIGFGKDASIAEKTKNFCKILTSSSNDEIKKTSYADLVKLGSKCLFYIQEFIDDPKNNLTSEDVSNYTVDAAYNEIKSNSNYSNDVSFEDEILIDNTYTMGGTYNFSKLDVKTEYGNLSVPKEKIKKFEIFISSVTNNAINFKLNANKHISGNSNGGWLKTGIQVKAGQKISVTANGEITLASLSNTKYKPDGSSKGASATSYTPPYNREEDDEYDDGGYASYGQIVYKVGEGELNKINVKGSNKIKSSGMLYISIYETVYNAGNSGSYQVNIKLN